MSMKRPRHNLGKAEWLGVEAIGVPGQRTFRLLVSTQQLSAQLWIEKEQLQALAEAVARMLAEIDAERGLGITPGREEPPPSPVPKPLTFPENPDIEIAVGALGLRYDPQRELVALEAYDREGTENDPPALRCLADRKQMESLHLNCVEVISAGRPRCPFCGSPLSAPGMPHFCPASNGHQKLAEEQ
jgi:uncharacterized repeat protein (TIGR03847 family)